MNRKTVYKLLFIWDWDEEERWLNEMSAQGWHFVQYSFPFRYTFEQGEPDAYQYQLQALEHRLSSRESQNYIAFLRDMDIELVASYLFWAYLRKPNDGKPFEIFSDVESKLRHMRRFASIPLVCLMMLCINLMWGAPVLMEHGGIVGMVLVALEIVLALLMIYGLTRMTVKYRELEKQRDMHE